MRKLHLILLALLVVALLAGCCTEHQWQDATCTAPKTCANCGKTEGEPLPHTWQDATCQAPKTCSVCQTTEGEIGGHVWQDATCAAPKTCSLCAATEGEVLAHDWAEATMDLPQTCNLCGATEGTAKNYFAVHGIEVQESLPAEFTTTAIIWKQYNEASQEVVPANIFNAHYYYSREDSRPDDQPGKSTWLRFTMELEGKAGGPKGMNAFLMDFNLYDLYTGQVFSYPGDESRVPVSLEIDGKTVDFEISWVIWDKWFEMDSAEDAELADGTVVKRIRRNVALNTYQMPEDYHGLVLAIGDLKHTDGKVSWGDLGKEGGYAADYQNYGDYYENVTFYSLATEEEKPETDGF